MVIVIFAAEELSFEQRMGHNICVPYNHTKSMKDNSRPGKIFPRGLSCMFRGVLISVLVTSSYKGSIKNDILTAVFQRLDELGVYARTPDRNPFALCNAHGSRIQVPFLRYINNPTHRLVFCIGLPNGTHKWQVGDSRE